jgi:O-antigen ligase
VQRSAEGTLLWRIPSLDALVFAAGGLAVLLIGSWVPDDRLSFSGVPTNTILLSLLAILATGGTIRRETIKNVALLQIPFILIFISILWSPVPEVGLDKFTNLVISGNLAFIMLNTVIERHGTQELVRILLVFLSVLLVCALAYKAVFGFFERYIRFFLNGPIVFARFMTIAVILSLFHFRGKKRILIVTLFSLAVLWTESKGPILAVLVALFAAVMYSASARQRIITLLGIAAVIAALFMFLRSVGLDNLDVGRLAILLSLLTGDYGTLANSLSADGSTGARTQMWNMTWELIFDYPLGVGLAGWSSYTDTMQDAPYPHNLFLELWSESGIVLGTIAAIPFVFFLFCKKGIYWFVAFSLFLAQMVSGDLADTRLMFAFSLLACFSIRDEGSALRALKRGVAPPEQIRSSVGDPVAGAG